MEKDRSKLFIGQHFIYSLRVIEHYLRVLAEDPQKVEAITEASVATELAGRDERILAEQEADARTRGEQPYQPWNVYDRQMLDLLLKPLHGHKGVADGVVSPHSSMVFSSVALGTMMGVGNATLNNHMQIFDKKQRSLRGSAAVRFSTPKEIDNLTAEGMSRAPYRAKDARVTPNLDRLVRFVTKDSGFFDGINLIYYLLYRWHRIDYSHIWAIEKDGVVLPYRDELMNVLKLLEERRLGFDVQEVLVLIDEYFEYYARFISDARVIEALDYSYHTCWQYNSPARTEAMLRDLWAVHRAFYTLVTSPSAHSRGPHKGRAIQSQRCISGSRGVWLQEAPRIPDRLPYAACATWAGSFENAFASAVERKKRTDKTLTNLRKLADGGAIFTPANCDELQLLLETANMTPGEHSRFNSNIHYYDAVDEDLFVGFEGLEFAPPYYPLIDSRPGALLNQDNFQFDVDPAHLVPPLEVGPFKPLLDDFHAAARYHAINVGYPGISEFKIYLYCCEADGSGEGGDGDADGKGGGDSGGGRPATHYTAKAGKSDYFTGIARKDLFSRFLVPSVGNLRQPLLYLLEQGTLPELVPLRVARDAQERYNRLAEKGGPSNVRLSQLLTDNPELEPELMGKVRDNVDEMYARLIAASHRRDEQGGLHFLDNGSTYTGCGTFVLTNDCDAAGRPRPYLLLEKRWRVSEENDNLSYPSGGSCDLYLPDDNVPQDCELLKELEANPFLTAARELREELNLMCSPGDLELVSFGIDVNRNLQQFSFVLETSQSAQRILERKDYATTPREGLTFFLPFQRQVICDILNNYQMESGAVYSLMRLMELKADKLWQE